MPDLITYDNGAVYDREQGRIVKGPTTGLFTSQTGRAAVTKRWEEKRAAFAEGFTEGIPENYASLKGSADAWRAVGKRMAEAIFAESKNQRGLAELVRTAGEFSGWTPNRDEQRQAPGPVNSVETLQAVTDLINAINQAAETERPQVIDVQPTEAE